jgi:hypothetical protein
VHQRAVCHHLASYGIGKGFQHLKRHRPKTIRLSARGSRNCHKEVGTSYVGFTSVHPSIDTLEPTVTIWSLDVPDRQMGEALQNPFHQLWVIAPTHLWTHIEATRSHTPPINDRLSRDIDRHSPSKNDRLIEFTHSALPCPLAVGSFQSVDRTTLDFQYRSQISVRCTVGKYIGHADTCKRLFYTPWRPQKRAAGRQMQVKQNSAHETRLSLSTHKTNRRPIDHQIPYRASICAICPSIPNMP